MRGMCQKKYRETCVRSLVSASDRLARNCKSEKRALRIVVRFGAGWSGQQGVDPRKKVERGDFGTFQQDPQARPPFVHGATFFSGQHHRRLRQASAHGKLLAGPFQPRLEIRSVFFPVEHVASGGSIPYGGQEHTQRFRLPPFRPFGYFTGSRVCAAGVVFSAMIWSRKCPASSNSSRDDASRISVSSCSIILALS